MTKNYQNVVVHHENITITDKVTLLLGKNGSGKSTLLKAICGLIQYDGDIKHNEIISYMPEKMELPNINSDTYLKLSTTDHALLEELIHIFDMKEHIIKDIRELSKGMKIKLRLISTLASKSDIYILDEPFNGIDKQGLKKLINYINRSLKRFLISTHIDMSDTLHHAKVILL